MNLLQRERHQILTEIGVGMEKVAFGVKQLVDWLSMV